jgi:hypothetical protein
MLREGFGAGSEKDVPDLQFGIAEEVAFGLADKQPRDEQEFLLGQSVDALR